MGVDMVAARNNIHHGSTAKRSLLSIGVPAPSPLAQVASTCGRSKLNLGPNTWREGWFLCTPNGQEKDPPWRASGSYLWATLNQ